MTRREAVGAGSGAHVAYDLLGRVDKGIQDYVISDSEGERAFAKDLDGAREVVVFAKLPRSFTIPTPVGNYAPDWAIAFNVEEVTHVYFVAETKGSLDTLELRGAERAKTACAKKMFEELDVGGVRYHVTTSYDDLYKVTSNRDWYRR